MYLSKKNCVPVKDCSSEWPCTAAAPEEEVPNCVRERFRLTVASKADTTSGAAQRECHNLWCALHCGVKLPHEYSGVRTLP
jgi:hypothetical protein